MTTQNPARFPNPARRAIAATAAATALALACTQAHAEKVLGSWSPLFQGIEAMSGYETDVHYAGESGTRRLAVNALRIDLLQPGLSFFSTPAAPGSGAETVSQSTDAFLVQYRLQAAINANFFSPCCDPLPQPKDLLGLAISQGRVVSPADRSTVPPGGTADSLVITTDRHALIAHIEPGADLTSFADAVSGGPVLLDQGRIAVAPVPPNAFFDKNPRSAVGTSATGSFLYLMTIDGRQPGYSDGATLYDTAGWLLALGAAQGLNLDGGGSTSLVVGNADGSARWLNHVPGGVPRLDGNSLGIWAPALPVPEPQTWAMLVAGMVAIAFSVGRRRGRE